MTILNFCDKILTLKIYLKYEKTGGRIMGVFFGTDGVRGIANKDLTPERAFELGQAGAIVLAQNEHHTPRILIGKDTRISSDMLEAALASGATSVGADVILVGHCPTPCIAYLTRTMNVDAGVMISASHNPMEYNGIKFFNKEGYKLSDQLEEQIEDIILTKQTPIERAIGADVGRIHNNEILTRNYLNFLATSVEVSLSSLKIVLDCANGASYKLAHKLFASLGANVIAINDTPNGININENCGSTHLEGLVEAVMEYGADLGLAFDGDADRCLAVDENGKLVDGDKLMAICALQLKKENALKNNTVVSTVMSNIGLGIAMKENNIELVQTKVGDRYVLEEMIASNYCIGGEQSGHIIFLDINTTGDGMLTGLKVAETLAKTGKKLSKMAEVMEVYPQVLLNAKIDASKKPDYRDNSEIMKEISKVETEVGDTGRVLIRPSGTEPLIRVMLEGKDVDFISSKAKYLCDFIETKLG